MNDETASQIAFLAIIAGRTHRDALLTALHDIDIHMINIVYGKGTVEASVLQSMFGLVPEENKLMITSISTYSRIETALRMLETKFGFNKSNTGIAFTIPVDKVSY